MGLSRITGAFLVGLAAIAGGCASEAPPKAKPRAESQRVILNEGASIFYGYVSDLSKLDLIFLIKSESKSVNAVTTDVTEYAGSLMKVLERAARDHPVVDITLDPMPVIQQRTQRAVAKDRLLSFAPMVGLAGESFDRRVLQTEEGVLNLLRFLAQALAEEEPEPSLKKIWAGAHTRFEELYQRVLKLLEDKYYINEGERKAKK